MIVIALLFYGFVGLFIASLILDKFGLLPNPKKKNQQGTPTAPATTPTPLAPANPHAPTTMSPGSWALIAVCVIGLPLGLAWLGGKIGSGNAVFPSSGGGSGYQAPVAPQRNSGAVWVNGYYRQDGTYVQGHYRSSPDGDPSNNWSNEPNVNPYTGKPGTHQPPKGK